MTRTDDYVGLLFYRGQPKCVHTRACMCQVQSMPCGTCSGWRTSDFPVVWVLPGRRAESMPPVVESSSVAVKHRDWKPAGLEWGMLTRAASGEKQLHTSLLSHPYHLSPGLVRRLPFSRPPCLICCQLSFGHQLQPIQCPREHLLWLPF